MIVLSRQYKLEVQLVVKLANNSAIKTDTTTCGTLNLTSELLHTPVPFDLDPATGSQSPAHCWIADRFAKVLKLSLAFAIHVVDS